MVEWFYSQTEFLGSPDAEMTSAIEDACGIGMQNSENQIKGPDYVDFNQLLLMSSRFGIKIN